MIYVVLVNWKGYRDTIECLESLARMDKVQFRVIVVDNESDPDGVEQVANWARGGAADTDGPPWPLLAAARTVEVGFLAISADQAFHGDTAPLVTLIVNQENSGFAGACNMGIRAALSDPACDFVWLLNNDTVVDAAALLQLVNVARADPAIGMCGSTLLYYDTPDIVQTIGGVFDRYFGRVRNIMQGVALRDIGGVSVIAAPDYICGASMLVSRPFLTTVGLMLEDYFLYFEEIDWSSRNNGRFKLAWSDRSLVYHKEGRSIGTNSRGRPSNTTLYYYNVNFLRFTKRYSSWLLPLAGLKVFAVAGYFWFKRDAAGFRVVGMALCDFVKGKRRRGPIA